MKAWIGAAGVFLAAAAGAHLGVMAGAPRVIMDRAMDGLAPDGASNRMVLAPRATAANRVIVRPSPDLAYSVCVFDVAEGPVHLRAAPWDDYMSLALYDADSNNFWRANDSAMGPTGIEVVMVAKGAPKPETHLPIVVSPTTRGVVLVRRLAPNTDRFAAADAVRQLDLCEAWRPMTGGAGG